MRRENERKHQENIDLILKINSDNLENSKVIFIYAPGFNRSIFLDNDKPLATMKNKLISLPYSINKANYTSMMDAAKKISSVEVTLKDDQLFKIFN